MLTNLVLQGNLQLSLFEKGEDTLEKVGQQRQLMQAMDEINKRFGKDTVIVGATGLKRLLNDNKKGSSATSLQLWRCEPEN